MFFALLSTTYYGCSSGLFFFDRCAILVRTSPFLLSAYSITFFEKFIIAEGVKEQIVIKFDCYKVFKLSFSEKNYISDYILHKYPLFGKFKCIPTDAGPQPIIITTKQQLKSRDSRAFYCFFPHFYYFWCKVIKFSQDIFFQGGGGKAILGPDTVLVWILASLLNVVQNRIPEVTINK